MIPLEEHDYDFFMLGVEARNAEMKITAVDDIIISAAGTSGSDSQQHRLPTSMKLVKKKEIKMPSRVCHYKGNTYVARGFGMSIAKIDGDGRITEGIINVITFVNGLIAHDDRLYAAIRDFHQTNVVVYQLSDKMVHSLKHINFKALTVFRDQLVIAEVNKFIIHSLTGERLRVVGCNQLGTRKVSLCHAGGDSIIVTKCDASPAMLKFNLATAAVEWTSNDVKQPSAVAMLNKKYALVTENQSSDHVKLFIIDQTNGENGFNRFYMLL